MRDLIIAIYVAECKHKKKLITQDSEFCPLCAGEKGVSFGWMKVSLAGTMKVFMNDMASSAFSRRLGSWRRMCDRVRSTDPPSRRTALSSVEAGE